MYGTDEKALFHLGYYTFEGRECRLGYSWPMLYVQCGPDGEVISHLAESAAELAEQGNAHGERLPLGEAYARAVAQGYLRKQAINKPGGP